MKDSWILSYERLRDWVNYVKEDKKVLSEDLSYILYEMSTSHYPNDLSHLERMIQLHGEAARMLTSVLVENCFGSIHYDLYSPRENWVLTKEKLEEIYNLVKKDEMEKVLNFFHALNYRIYLKGWEAGFIEVDETLIKIMLNEHQDALRHLDKAMDNRRLRILTNQK